MQLMSADHAFTDSSGSTEDTAFTLAGHSVMLAARRWNPSLPATSHCCATATGSTPEDTGTSRPA